MSDDAKLRLREIARNLSISEDKFEDETHLYSLIKDKLEMWGDEPQEKVNYAQDEKNGREFIEASGGKEALLTENDQLLKNIKFPNS